MLTFFKVFFNRKSDKLRVKQIHVLKNTKEKTKTKIENEKINS